MGHRPRWPTNHRLAREILENPPTGKLKGERRQTRVHVGVALASGAASFEMSSASAFALLAAALWAGTMLMLRAFSGEEGALAQVVAANVVFVLVTGACALVLPLLALFVICRLSLVVRF